MLGAAPDRPESVALVLMCEVMKREEAAESRDRPERRNRRSRDAVLDLFSEYLKAARGERNAGIMMH